MLDEVAEELPQAFFRELNGGICLLPDTVRGELDGLYVMGCYHAYSAMGRYIEIYYGSFEAVYQWLSPAELREKLKQVLVHEFTHHMESLAGERGLEIKDERDMERYRQERGD
jgi:hypothetical protein